MITKMAHYHLIALLAILSCVGITFGFFDEPFLDDYNPFKTLLEYEGDKSGSRKNSKKYEQTHLWKHLFFGDFTVSVGEYFSQSEYDTVTKSKQGKRLTEPEKRLVGCKRVYIFSMRQVVLDGVVLTKDCTGPKNLAAQLMTLDNALWHYPDLRIKPDPTGQRVTVVKLKKRKAGDRMKYVCEKKNYQIGQSSIATAGSPDTVDLDSATDEDCRALIGQVGIFPALNLKEFIQGTGRVSVFSSNEPYLGFKLFPYEEPFCHWKLNVYGNKQDLTTTGLFCGEFGNIVVTTNELHYRKNIIARVSSTDPTEVTVLLNLRNGECMKRQYKLSTTFKEGKPAARAAIRSVTTMHELDQECEAFMTGRLTDQIIKMDKIEAVIKQIREEEINVVPFSRLYMNKGHQIGPIVFLKQDYNPMKVIIHVSNGKDLDVLIIENGIRLKMIVLIAKGVIMDVASINGIPNFDVTSDSIISGPITSIERDPVDQNLFTVLNNWDDKVCTRTRYVVTNKGGRHHRQEVFPEEIGVWDDKCRLLLKSKGKKGGTENDPSITLGYDTAEPDLIGYLS